MLKATQTDIDEAGSLRYFRVGKGETIVFLHGYPDNLQVWSKLIPLMENEFEVLAFDWPGLGYSSEWKGGAVPTGQAKKLIKILDHFKLEKVHLVAHDMGGQPALVAAAMFPDRIKSVAVMNSLVMWNAKTSWEIKYLRNFRLNKFFLTFFPKLVFNRAIGTFGKSKSNLLPAIKEDLWNAFKQPTVRKFIVRLCAGYQAQLPRLARYYEKIGCPTYILWAKEGKHFPIDHAKKLNVLIENSEIEILQGVGHWMAYFNAEIVSEKLNFFYEKHFL